MPKEPNIPQKPEPEASDDLARNWEKDQKQREYYYDDAHGYQTYEGEFDDDPDEVNKNTPGHDS